MAASLCYKNQTSTPMKTKHLFSTTILAACLFAACNTGNDKAAEAEEKAKADLFAATTESAPPPPIDAGGISEETISMEKSVSKSFNGALTDESEQKANQGPSAVPAQKTEEKIRKTAVIDLTVDDYKKTRAAIDNIIRSGKAYLGNENEQHSTYNISNSMVIRVANADFDRMVSNISGLEGHVNSKNIYIEDVTAQFVDITARLKSKKEVELRYRELLQKAVRVSDVLEVEEQLRMIREEIEAKEGELKYLNDQVSYSTINLSFHQDFEFTPSDSPGFFGRMGSAFGNGWNGFLSFLIGIVYAWPLWLVLGISGFFVYRFVKRKLRK